MKRIPIIYLIAIFLFSACAQSEIASQGNSERFTKKQNEKHDTKSHQHLKGKVKSIKETGHDYTVGGELVQENKSYSAMKGMDLFMRLHSNLTFFDASGNLLSTNYINEEGELIKVKSYEWDASNNLIKSVFHKAEEKVDSIIYKYDYSTREITENVYYKKQAATYNLDSALASIPKFEAVTDLKAKHEMDSIMRSSILAYAKHYNENPYPSTVTFISKYDHTGVLLERAFLNSDNRKEIQSKYVTSYQNGRLLKVNCVQAQRLISSEKSNNTSGENDFGEVYKYDSNGNQIENTFINPDGSEGRIFAKEFDDRNNMVKEQMFSSAREVLVSEIIREYDSNNNVTKLSVNIPKEKSKVTLYKYDEKNNVVEERENGYLSTYEYGYDANDNWIFKQKTTTRLLEKGNESHRTIYRVEREIVYH